MRKTKIVFSLFCVFAFFCVLRAPSKNWIEFGFFVFGILVLGTATVVIFYQEQHQSWTRFWEKLKRKL